MTSPGFHFDNTYLDLPEAWYSKLSPVPVTKPEMVILNLPLATDVGLDFSGMSLDEQTALFVKLFLLNLLNLWHNLYQLIL